jgi:glycosyltransferase involved in cell wall biosynthesis
MASARPSSGMPSNIESDRAGHNSPTINAIVQAAIVTESAWPAAQRAMSGKGCGASGMVKWPVPPMPFEQADVDKRIRALRIITRLNVGGPAIQAMTLSERLESRGFETLLIHGQLDAGEGDMRYLLPASVAVRHLPTLRRPLALAHDGIALAQLLDVMRDFRPQIVHTHMAKAGTLGRLAAAIYNQTAGRSRRAAVVHTYHGHVLEGYFNAAKTRTFLAIERALARATDRIVAISPTIRAQLLDDYGIGQPRQYAVVPLGFELGALAAIDDSARAAARAALDLAPSAHVVTTVGRLTAIKQHMLFLEAAALVAAHDPHAVFVVAGDGELRGAIEDRALALGLDGRVRFLGWRRDLPTIYGASDLFLLTSRNEGTPVALIESLAAGVPGVCTDVGGVRDVIDSDAVGLLAPDGDAPALAAHVGGLLADPHRRRRMGAAGRALVLARYSLDRLVDDVEAVYRGLLH